MDAPVVIIGAGLSGLRAATELQLRGVPCIVLEARNRIGGRILSLGPNAPDDLRARYDLGPAWFWPDMQPRMARLIAELELTAFPQHTHGAVLVERFRLEPVQRYERGINAEPRSMRISGGMQTLADALASQLPHGAVRLGFQVTEINESEGGLEVRAVGPQGSATFRSEMVILALPPRVAASAISFGPSLPDRLLAAMETTSTWMAGHAKVVVSYELPYWRERGLSGTASSFVGPLAEIHDASAFQGRPALFGFVGVASADREAMGVDRLRAACLSQFARLFGDEAASPDASFVMDWAQDPFTATAADIRPGGHPWFDPSSIEDLLGRKIIAAGSETAGEHCGYLEGALESADRAVRACLELLLRRNVASAVR